MSSVTEWGRGRDDSMTTPNKTDSSWNTRAPELRKYLVHAEAKPFPTIVKSWVIYEQ